MIKTKRIFTALLLAIIAVTSYAYDFEVDGIYYNLDSNGDAVVTNGAVKYSDYVYLPHKVEWNGKERKVVGIGSMAFHDCQDLKYVSLGAYTTYIGQSAFSECHNLISVTLTDVTSIGSYAFYDCRNLESITIPGSVERIGVYAFAFCMNLKEITIPTAVTEIPKAAFACCEKLKKVKLYGQVTSIGETAFENCRALVDFYCYALNVPKMGANVFRNIDLYNSFLYMPEGKMDEYMDDETWGQFGTYYITNEVKRDGYWYRFERFGTRAAIINNPDEYGHIIRYYGDVAIPYQITVGNKKYSVTGIGDNAFLDSDIKSVSIPMTVDKIGEYAFSNTCLELLIIPNSVREIGEHAFFNNKYLKKLVLPKYLKTIPLAMAWYCDRLEEVRIPNTVETIEERAFLLCESLKSIIIPSSVTSIGYWALAHCTSMTDIYCQATNVPNTDLAAFDNSPIENMTLYVPSESINAYKITAPWSGFGNIKALTTGIEKTETASKPMITTVDGQISVSGLSGNATIQVLSLDGKLLDSSTALDGTATLNALSGEVVIVKVGTESYKVVVK